MVAKDQLLPPADQVIDVQGKHVLPGVIDPHVHMGIYMPFESDMETETAAAAAGGVTTILHHTFDKRSIRTFIPEMAEVVGRKAHMDVGFTVCIMGMDHIQELEEAFKLGVTSFKVFLNRPEYEPLFGIRHPDDGELVMAMERLRDLGGL
ncbi:MAG: hypothetical protein ACE5PO_01340, partial [Candidatus Bathyarchaeia archaeon]